MARLKVSSLRWKIIKNAMKCMKMSTNGGMQECMQRFHDEAVKLSAEDWTILRTQMAMAEYRRTDNVERWHDKAVEMVKDPLWYYMANYKAGVGIYMTEEVSMLVILGVLAKKQELPIDAVKALCADMKSLDYILDRRRADMTVFDLIEKHLGSYGVLEYINNLLDAPADVEVNISMDDFGLYGDIIDFMPNADADRIIQKRS